MPLVRAASGFGTGDWVLQPGTILGNYEVCEPIAGGGMGFVYRVKHRALGTQAALKVMLATYAANERVRERFRQEAHVQANLSHPHIVRVSDFIDDHQSLGIVMDLVEGPSLEQVLTDRGAQPWSLAEMWKVMGPVVDAVAYAHGRGVVHRDLKPGNILLERSAEDEALGLPKVTDFGLAKILSVGDKMTKTGARMGSVPFMAPEQYRGEHKIFERMRSTRPGSESALNRGDSRLPGSWSRAVFGGVVAAPQDGDVQIGTQALVVGQLDQPIGDLDHHGGGEAALLHVDLPGPRGHTLQQEPTLCVGGGLDDLVTYAVTVPVDVDPDPGASHPSGSRRVADPPSHRARPGELAGVGG